METQNQNFGAPPPPVAPVPPPSSGKNTGMAILAYLGILVVVPLIVAKDDPFVKFHSKQGLVLLVGWIILMVIGMVPVLGWLIAAVLWLSLAIFSIIGIVNAATGKETPLPVIGGLANQFNI